MPRKQTHLKQQIIDAAFDIADKEGFDQLTVRKIAGALGCSVAPIYVNFSDFQQLKTAVIQKINAVAVGLVTQTDTGNPLSDIGRASIRFAYQHPKLFQDYILGKYEFEPQDALNAYVFKSIRKDPATQSLTEAEITQYLTKIRIYQIGLSVLASTESINRHSEQSLMDMLEEMSQTILDAIRMKKRRQEESL